MSYTPNNEPSGPNAPLDLSTYTRSMHQYTHAQLGQMRAAISSAAETANGTMRDREEAALIDHENEQVRNRTERERESNRRDVERQMSRESMGVVGGRDFA